MEQNLVEVLLNNEDIIQSDDMIGLWLTHFHYGRGRVTGYCIECQTLTTEFRDGDTKVVESLYDVLEDEYRVDTKQLKRRLGYLREKLKVGPQKRKRQVLAAVELLVNAKSRPGNRNVVP